MTPPQSLVDIVSSRSAKLREKGMGGREGREGGREWGRREGKITVCYITKDNLRSNLSSPLTDSTSEKKAIDSTHTQKGQTLREGATGLTSECNMSST